MLRDGKRKQVGVKLNLNEERWRDEAQLSSLSLTHTHTHDCAFLTTVWVNAPKLME